MVEILSTQHSTNFKLFSETGIKLSKALGVIVFDVYLIETIDLAGVVALLNQYDEYLQNNLTIFDNITNHHASIVNEEWSEVAKDSSSLAVYSSAASSMGSKKWVVECNQWMETFALNYFRSGGARKHYIKQLRTKTNHLERTKADADRESTEFGKLASDLLAGGADEGFTKLRLLDVGSCYNPIAKSKDANQFEVTALDLYPADPSVYQCDFLNLKVGEKGSHPVILEHTPATTKEDENPTKRQKTNATSNETDSSVLAAPSTVPDASSCLLEQLPAASFDAVTMSLVLNYLPTSEQRLQMVRTARDLLVSPRTQEAEGSDWPPHRNGILLIAEKQSIFKSPSSGNTMKPAKAAAAAEETDLWSNWVNAINSCGFELVKYHFLPTSDGRKSHLFAFATTGVRSPTPAESSLKLSIKQDFGK